MIQPPYSTAPDYGRNNMAAYAGDEAAPGEELRDIAAARLARIKAGQDLPAALQPGYTPPPLLALLQMMFKTRAEQSPNVKGTNIDTMTQNADAMVNNDQATAHAGREIIYSGLIDRAPHYDGATEGYATGTSGPSFKSSPQQSGDIAYQGEMNPTALGNPNPSPNMGAPGMGASQPSPGYPQGAYNAGGSVYPWLQPYQGQFTAPMSPTQLQGLSGYQNFLQSGINPIGYQVPGMQAPDPTSPYFSEYAQGSGQLKDIMDARAKQAIASSMAAGGLALSGARSTAEQQYQNQSDAQYQQMLGQFQNQDWLNYQNLRNQQQIAGMQAGTQLENTSMNQQLAQQQMRMGGYQNLFNMGGVAQQTQQNELNQQYNDYLRQIGAYQQAFNQPFQQGLQVLQGGQYPNVHYPIPGNSPAMNTLGFLSSLFGGGQGQGGQGGSVGNNLMSALSNLFGGGGGTPAGNPGTSGYQGPGYQQGGSVPPGWGVDPSQVGTGTGDISQWDYLNNPDMMNTFQQYPSYDPNLGFTVDNQFYPGSYT